MLINTERLRWVRPHKGYYAWTSDDAEDASGTSAVRWARMELWRSSIDLGPEEYLVREDFLTRPGESDQELEARLDGLSPSDQYTPGNIQNLYKTFAFTEPTRDQIMAFAEKYGDLGLSHHYFNQMLDEPISLWMANIIIMREAYCLWSAIKRDDEQELIAIFKQRIQLAPKEPRRIVQWAWRQIADALSLGLQEYNVDCDFDVVFSSVGSDPTGVQYQFVPNSLISFIWLQFAAVVAGGNRWNVCQYCGEPFEIKRKGQRACSESHRQMAYRKRKQSKK